MGDLAVRGSAPASAPLPPQTIETKNETKSATNQTVAASSQKVEVNTQHAAQMKSETGVTGSIKKQQLNETLSARKAEPKRVAEAEKEVSGPLPKQARLRVTGMAKAEYDFGRPITQEQAARVIFKDGKVPEGAKLTQGPGPNSWTLKSADFDTHQSVLTKMRSHTETTQQDGSVIAEWPDLPIPASEATVNKRWDLNNDFGFKINGKYDLDEGKSQTKYVTAGLGTGKGKGFVLEFEKPLTKDQALEKLFDKSKLPNGAVKLIPVPQEPTTTWQVEIIAADAEQAYKPRISRAFGSATDKGTQIARPGLPAGILNHINNKTVPENATKHAPNVYVWEQEGHLVRVEKGNNGYYSYETTKLHPTDKAGNDTIRYFMKDQGMKSRDAWQAYVKHWDDIHKGIITAYAIALSSGRMPGKAPRIDVERRIYIKPNEPSVPRAPRENIPVKTNGTTLNTKAPTVETNIRVPNGEAPAAKPKVDPYGKTDPAINTNGRTEPAVNTNGKTIDAPASKETPAPKAYGSTTAKDRRLPDSTEVTIKTADGPRKMTAGEYRRKVRAAEQWKADQVVLKKRKNDESLIDEAAKLFGLDKNWYSAGNRIVY
jgi:hypothetical protein